MVCFVRVNGSNGKIFQLQFRTIKNGITIESDPVTQVDVQAVGADPVRHCQVPVSEYKIVVMLFLQLPLTKERPLCLFEPV